jgi:hypothetical protein
MAEQKRLEPREAENEEFVIHDNNQEIQGQYNTER